MYSYGPNLGCVLKLGYRRPLDDSDYLGDITWEVNSNDEEICAAFDKENDKIKSSKSKSKNIKTKENRKSEQETNTTLKRRTKRFDIKHEMI